MRIGNVDLGDKPVLLAPMEDVTDASFRVVCKKLGADIVYNELIIRGYEVYVGKTKTGEIDFVATLEGNTKYIQVTYELNSEEVIEREFGAFNVIDDNYPKYVISLDKRDFSRNGIKHLNLIDFLIKNEF